MSNSLRRLIPAIALLLATVSGRAMAQSDAKALTVAASNRTAEAEAARGIKRNDIHVHSGDVMKYTLTFTNLKDRNVRQVVMSNPIPSGLRMVAGSVRSSREDASAEFSADGGKTFSVQPMEEVLLDGKTVQRPVSPDRYTHVRWTVAGSVAPKATVTAEFEARLGPTSAAASKPSSASSNGR
jgi:uncharacterized repeat protein (TIGR01451 family)